MVKMKGQFYTYYMLYQWDFQKELCDRQLESGLGE